MIKFGNHLKGVLSVHSEIGKLDYDTSCLSLIHYSPQGIRLIFKANDIKNEAFIDFITINKFFIEPIYKQEIPQNLKIYCSSTQNHETFRNFIFNIKQILF